MIEYYKKVYWYDEVDITGGHNNGYIYGIYYYQDEDDFPVDVEWFQCEPDRDNTYEKLIAEMEDDDVSSEA
jgi:hypothetical protein